MEAAVKQETSFTYREYVLWETNERFELINGAAYAMASPSRAHQTVSMGLANQFYNYLKGKKCQVFAAPFDVCLNALGDNDPSVVQPDIFVVCDPSKLDDKRCNGAPDLIIEITSPSTSRRDKHDKLMEYQRVKVREYLIVDPEAKTVQAFVLQKGKYNLKVYDAADTVAIHILKDLTISLADVFV